jgi:hypothetical protein
MDTVSILHAGTIGKDFIPREYLKDGRDEYYYRDIQTLWHRDRWRHLRADEVERLVKGKNRKSTECCS